MIALAQRGSTMTCLFKTERGLLGGAVEPVDFHSFDPREGKSNDDALAVLGYVRTEDWRTVTDASGNAHTVARVVRR